MCYVKGSRKTKRIEIKEFQGYVSKLIDMRLYVLMYYFADGRARMYEKNREKIEKKRE